MNSRGVNWAPHVVELAMVYTASGCTVQTTRVRYARCATLTGPKTTAGAADQRERSRRWREGVKIRLDQIHAELAQLGGQIDAKLVALTDRLAEPERRADRRQ